MKTMYGVRQTPEINRAVNALGEIWECQNKSEIIRRCVLKVAKQHRINVTATEEVLA